MAPAGKPPHEQQGGPPHARQDSESRRAVNTPDNARKAVSASRACIESLEPGKVWRHRTPHGETDIKGALTLDDVPVLILHFSAEDASLLPKGLHSLSPGTADIIALAENRLKEVPGQITVLEGAEFREPESCWAIPVAHHGRIVGHLKVSSDGSRILPDKKAAEEMGK